MILSFENIAVMSRNEKVGCMSLNKRLDPKCNRGKNLESRLQIVRKIFLEKIVTSRDYLVIRRIIIW